jgi:hypothetical protein
MGYGKTVVTRSMPVSVEVLRRMPLAEAALSVWQFVFDSPRLQSIWDQHRGRCYEKIITFATMVELVWDALVAHQGSGRRSFEKSIEAGQLNASVQAAFKKLGRLPISVSQALLEEGVLALRELIPSAAMQRLPDSLQEFNVLVFDGKTIKNVAKRLKPLRRAAGGLLGGKALVMQEWKTGLVVSLQADPDGDASEKPLVGVLTPRTRQCTGGPRLFVGDRFFGDLVQAAHLTAQAGDHFLLRAHSGAVFQADPSRPEQRGTDAAGRRYVEAWGWFGSVNNKRRRYVRRIHLARPEEKDDLVLVTDLVDERRYLVADLLWLYRQRWGIERMFQQVTEVFRLERLIGGTPQACIFQFAFCLLLYNLMQVVRALIANAKPCAVEEISTEKLFDDVARHLTAWTVLITPRQTVAYFSDVPTSARLSQKLHRLLNGVWSETWRKSPQQNRRPRTRHPRRRTHASVHRLLQKEHAKHTNKHKPDS